MRRFEVAAAVVVGFAATGCQTINGVIYGLERDVDTLVAAMDRATADLLPPAGPSPQQYQPTHVDFPDQPSPSARHTRFGKPHQ